MSKVDDKAKAITLRRSGLSYSEILEIIPVARSTLSRWLREVGLSQPQKQRLTKKKGDAQRKGAWKVRQLRIERTRKIKQKSVEEVGRVNFRDLWMAGIALYWAEGSKQTRRSISQCVSFSNSDPGMINFFLNWLRKVCKIKQDRIKVELYLHLSARGRKREIVDFWRDKLKIRSTLPLKIYWKRHKVKFPKKNQLYFGLVRVKVRTSTDLNRRIEGWIEGLKNFNGE